MWIYLVVKMRFERPTCCICRGTFCIQISCSNNSAISPTENFLTFFSWRLHNTSVCRSPHTYLHIAGTGLILCKIFQPPLPLSHFLNHQTCPATCYRSKWEPRRADTVVWWVGEIDKWICHKTIELFWRRHKERPVPSNTVHTPHYRQALRTS